jgi:lipid A 3-O-deacylase
MKHDLILLCSLLSASILSHGATAEAQTASSDWNDLFKSGQFESSVGGGVMFSPFGPTRNRPTVRYAQQHLDLGYMLTDVVGNGFYRGNLELVGEMYGAEIYRGAGDYFAGSTFNFRYNFLVGNAAWVPFVQLGGGFLFTDYDRQIVGQAFQFDLESVIGLRRFITKRISLNLEYRMQHISNANSGPHNLGINSHGPSLSASWFF